MRKITLLIVSLSFFVFGNAQNHWTESFENPLDTWSSYTTGPVEFQESGVWDFVSVYPEASGASYDGAKACRINDDVAGASITSPAVNSAGTISFYYHMPFSGAGTFDIQYSIDGGAFSTLASVDFSTVTTPTYYSYDLNNTSDNIRVRVQNDDNTGHLTIDYFIITQYSGGGNQAPVISNIVHTPEFPTSSETVSISADVTDDVTVSSVNCFWSLVDGGTYSQIAMTGTGDSYTTNSDIAAQADGATVYYYIEATDDESETTTSAQQSYTVADPVTTTLPYSQTFDSDLDDCTPFSVSGATKEWYANSGTANMNGYNSGDIEEDWLILPGIDIGSYTDVVMTFDNWHKYPNSDDNGDGSNYLKLMYSEDYSGTGDPSSSTWNELNFVVSPYDTWGSAGLIDLSAISGSSVYIAFKYRYEAGRYKWWQIDNLSIYEGSRVNVTFQVNMEYEGASLDGVFLAGSFNEWLPSADELTVDVDEVYTITKSLITGVEYQFKYVNGSSWEDVPAGCEAPGYDNRFEIIGASDYDLDLVCFSSCNNCGDNINYDITFQVDMQNESVDPAGVFLAGDFNGWTNELMTNNSGTVWELTVSLEEESFQAYKFKNGVDGWENDPNRSLIVPAATTTLDLVCFNLAYPCAPDLLISEVADPGGSGTHIYRFIELYNASDSEIDFSSGLWYLVKQTGASGGGATYDIPLTGTLAAGGKYTVAYNGTDFNTAYGFSPDLVNGNINGNGDDPYYLYYGGGYGVGTLIDAYGWADDGTGTDWEYLDTKAVRLNWVSEPSATWQSWEWHIPGSAGTLDMTPSAHKESVNWVGTSGTEWTTKGDWSGSYGFIPDASFDVTIPDVANQPIISTEAACNNLTIDASSTLDVGVTTFDIFGNLANNGGTFTIGSNTTQNASVIVHATAIGDATVERYFQGYDDGANNGWHNISSPVNSMIVAGSDFDPTGTDDDLYWWEETTNKWKNYKANAFDFTNGQGYLFASQSDGTRNFVGTLNTETVEVTGLTKGDGGFHLLGNPFASAVVWDDGNWNLSNIGPVAQIWDESNNSYAQISAWNVIPPAHGFFVEVSSDPGSLDIHKWSRTHSITDNYKSTLATNLEETIDLKVTNDENSFYDICRVGFKDDATEEWDIEYDAHKLFGGSGTSQLWSVMDDEQFVYNYLPYVYESYQLPIHFRAGTNATHHINVTGIESFYGNSGIYLEDLQTGNLVNLSEQQLYTFTASTEDDEARFILHFSSITSVGEDMLAEDVQIYSTGNSVYFKFDRLLKGESTVSVFNTLGQQVYGGDVEQSTLSSIRLNEKPGIYIVRLQSEEGTTTQKVMIK